MSRDPPTSAATQNASLRARAEAILRSRAAKRSRNPEDSNRRLQRLVEELEIHQVELELQNETLRTAEQVLAASRDKYRRLYDLAPIGYLTMNRTSEILEANVSACSLLTTKLQELIGRPLASYLDEEDANVLHFHLVDTFDHGMNRAYETTLQLRVAGREEPIPVRIRSTLFADVDSGESRCQTVLVDLTELRAADLERRASFAGYQAAMEVASDGVVITDARDNIQYLNPAAERAFGYSSTQACGLNIRALLPQLDRNDSARVTRDSTTAGQALLRLSATDGETLVGVRKDGTTFPVDLGVAEWRHRNRRMFTVSVRDKSECENAKANFRQSERRFRQIADHLGDVLMLTDRKTNSVLFASRAFESILGSRAPKGACHDPAWFRAISKEDRPRIGEAYRTFLKGDPFDEEVQITHPEGEKRWLRIRAFPIEEEDGRVERDVVIMQDVTGDADRKEELRHAQKMETMGMLVVGVTHDFGNVLQAALGCVNLARAGGTLRRSPQEYLERAADAIRHGGDLASQLMGFVKRHDTKPRPLELDVVVRRVAKLLEHVVTEKISIDLALRAPGELVLVDPVHIEQILMNLVSNARAAMPAGGTISIETVGVKCWRAEQEANFDPQAPGYVQLIVRDSGIGMSEETKNRVLEPLLTTKPAGIGLSTVTSIMRQVEGRIHLQSEPNEGTTFTLSFLYHGGAAVPESTEGRRLSTFRGVALLVEDDSLVRTTVRDYLEDLGFTVLEANDAVEAQLQFGRAKRDVNLLVTDVVLPSSSGTKLAAALRGKNPSLPVLFMSADPEVVEDDEGFLGGLPLLVKPFGEEDLSDVLGRLLEADSLRVISPDESASFVVPSGRVFSKPKDKTILLVENEPLAREALEELLLQEGYRVLAAKDATTAIEFAERGQPIDLLLTDLRLPDMRWEELVQSVRHEHPRVSVTIMSGAAKPQDIDATFVSKPIELDALLTIVEGQLAALTPYASPSTCERPFEQPEATLPSRRPATASPAEAGADVPGEERLQSKSFHPGRSIE